LSARGLVFHPPCHVGDEWFVPIGIPAIFIPFFLVHDRLRALERTMMLEVEGGTPEWFMKLMRHEAGHAYMYAYRLTRKKRWQELFGQTSREETPDSYRPRPFSRSYVMHLEDWYAQSHPDEDFAETFAVWLTPGAEWRARYEGWPVLKKLEYVDELMREIGPRAPLVTSHRRVDPLTRMRKTLRRHYDAKRARYGADDPNAYDRVLRRLFSDAPAYSGNAPAWRFLARFRKEVRRTVARWTGEYQYTIDQVLNDMMRRCQELKLRLVTSEEQTRLDFTIVLTVQTMNYLHSGQHRVWL